MDLKKWFQVGAAGVLSLGILAGCGDDTNEEPTTPESPDVPMEEDEDGNTNDGENNDNETDSEEENQTDMENEDDDSTLDNEDEDSNE